MKKTIITVAAAIALLALINNASSQQREPVRTRRHCVILQGFQTYQHNPDQTWGYSGIGIYCSSSSEGAPAFPAPMFGTNEIQSTSMAEAVAQLLSQGYRIEHWENLNAVMIK